MEKKLVSAIITTHNRKNLLCRAISSVFSQTYSPIELIVVDDHSDDETSTVCKDSRITYIYIPKEESKGGNYARNLGVKASNGEYCAFLDDDDYWLPTKIEKQVAIIEKNDCELVHCGCRKEYVEQVGTRYSEVLPHPLYSGDLSRRILYTICTTTSCILVKRKALFDIGLFDEDLKFWQEYELTIRLAQRKPFYFVDEALLVYRVDTQDKNRLTNKYYEWCKATKYIRQKHAVLYSKLNFKEQLKVKDLIWRDAVDRCKSSGLQGHYYFYKFLTSPHALMRFFRKMLD